MEKNQKLTISVDSLADGCEVYRPADQPPDNMLDKTSLSQSSLVDARDSACKQVFYYILHKRFVGPTW